MRNQVELVNNPQTSSASYHEGGITPLEDSLEKESMLSPLKQNKFQHNENASGPSQLTSIRNHSEEEKNRLKKIKNMNQMNQDLPLSAGSDGNKSIIQYETTDVMRKTFTIKTNQTINTPINDEKVKEIQTAHVTLESDHNNKNIKSNMDSLNQWNVGERQSIQRYQVNAKNRRRKSKQSLSVSGNSDLAVILQERQNSSTKRTPNKRSPQQAIAFKIKPEEGLKSNSAVARQIQFELMSNMPKKEQKKGHLHQTIPAIANQMAVNIIGQGLNQTLAIQSLTKRSRDATQVEQNNSKTFDVLERTLSKSQLSSKKLVGPEKYALGMNLTRITEFEKDNQKSILNSQESIQEKPLEQEGLQNYFDPNMINHGDVLNTVLQMGNETIMSEMEGTRDIPENVTATFEKSMRNQMDKTMRINVDHQQGSRTGLEKYSKNRSGQSSLLRFNQVQNTNYQTITNSFNPSLVPTDADVFRASPTTTFQKQKYLINNRNDSLSFQVQQQKEANFVEQLRKFRVEKMVGTIYNQNRNFVIKGQVKEIESPSVYKKPFKTRYKNKNHGTDLNQNSDDNTQEKEEKPKRTPVPLLSYKTMSSKFNKDLTSLQLEDKTHNDNTHSTERNQNQVKNNQESVNNLESVGTLIKKPELAQYIKQSESQQPLVQAFVNRLQNNISPNSPTRSNQGSSLAQFETMPIQAFKSMGKSRFNLGINPLKYDAFVQMESDKAFLSDESPISCPKVAALSEMKVASIHGRSNKHVFVERNRFDLENPIPFSSILDNKDVSKTRRLRAIYNQYDMQIAEKQNSPLQLNIKDEFKLKAFQRFVPNKRKANSVLKNTQPLLLSPKINQIVHLQPNFPQTLYTINTITEMSSNKTPQQDPRYYQVTPKKKKLTLKGRKASIQDPSLRRRDSQLASFGNGSSHTNNLSQLQKAGETQTDQLKSYDRNLANPKSSMTVTNPGVHAQEAEINEKSISDIIKEASTFDEDSKEKMNKNISSQDMQSWQYQTQQQRQTVIKVLDQDPSFLKNLTEQQLAHLQLLNDTSQILGSSYKKAQILKSIKDLTNKKNDRFKGMIFDGAHFNKYKELRNGASELMLYPGQSPNNNEQIAFMQKIQQLKSEIGSTYQQRIERFKI